MPFAAMSARTSPATWRSRRVTCRLLPVKRATSAGSWVATPERAALAALAGRVARLRPGEVALAEHRAAHRHQQRGPEAHAVGAEQHQLERVLAGQHAAVDAHLDPLADALLDQHVLHRGQHRGHRHPAVLLVDALGGARPPAAVREVEPVGAGVDAAHARHLHPVGRHELERRVHVGVEVAPALDHELDVLDRVEVVVDGRRDELVPRLAAALVRRSAATTFLPGSWPPLPGLAPWANLTSASAARAAVIGVTVKRAPAYWMLRLPSARPMRALSKPPSPRVRDRADPRRDRDPGAAEAHPAVAVERVHRPRDRAVRGLGEGALAHPRRHEAPQHVLLALDLVERDRLVVGDDAEEVEDADRLALVDRVRERLVGGGRARLSRPAGGVARGRVQRALNDLGVVGVRAGPPCGSGTRPRRQLRRRAGAERLVVEGSATRGRAPSGPMPAQVPRHARETPSRSQAGSSPTASISFAPQ